MRRIISCSEPQRCSATSGAFCTRRGVAAALACGHSRQPSGIHPYSRIDIPRAGLRPLARPIRTPGISEGAAPHAASAAWSEPESASGSPLSSTPAAVERSSPSARTSPGTPHKSCSSATTPAHPGAAPSRTPPASCPIDSSAGASAASYRRSAEVRFPARSAARIERSAACDDIDAVARIVPSTSGASPECLAARHAVPPGVPRVPRVFPASLRAVHLPRSVIRERPAALLAHLDRQPQPQPHIVSRIVPPRKFADRLLHRALPLSQNVGAWVRARPPAATIDDVGSSAHPAERKFFAPLHPDQHPLAQRQPFIPRRRRVQRPLPAERLLNSLDFALGPPQLPPFHARLLPRLPVQPPHPLPAFIRTRKARPPRLFDREFRAAHPALSGPVLQPLRKSHR